MNRPLACLMLLSIAGSVLAQPRENTGPNIHLLRQIDGGYAHRTLSNVEATADLGKPMKADLNQMSYRVLGVEQVTVPAGTFEARRYRLMGATDVWVSGPDKLMIRMLMERFDREYVLTRLEKTEQ